MNNSSRRHNVVFRGLLVAGAVVIGMVTLGSSVSDAMPLPSANAAGPGSTANPGVGLGHLSPYLSHFKTVTNVSSTVPGNGDLNPYGIVDVHQTTGALVRGDTLVSNFNRASNLQGTGTTIV